MFLQKNNFFGHRFFESFLICSCFQTRREKISEFVNFVWKDSQNCFLRVQRKNRATQVLSKKNRFLSKTNSNFSWKNFQRFVKTTLYVSSGQIWGKTFFVGKINISFSVSWAKVFGKLAKIFQQGCQNCFPRVLREPMKNWNSEKNF